MQISQEFVDTDEYRQMVFGMQNHIGFLFNSNEGLHIYDGRIDIRRMQVLGFSSKSFLYQIKK